MTDDEPAYTTDEQESKFSRIAFAQGMAGVVLIYTLLIGWTWIGAGKTLESQQARLSSKTVVIQWPSGSHTSGNDGHGTEENEHAMPAIPNLPPEATMMPSGLVEAPLQGLFENTQLGPSPVIRKDGLTAFKAYRRPFDNSATDQPLVSLVIVDLGLSDLATENALHNMPPEVSLAISSYAQSPEFWVEEARARGHEIWMTLPLETHDFPQTDPGPHTMIIGAPERENMAKLSWLMTRTSGYVGFITTKQNSIFMNSIHDMRSIVGALYSHGLGFANSADSNTASIPATMAHGMGAAYAPLDTWIDEPAATQENIRNALHELEEKAREHGRATGVIHPLPVSYQEILRWIDTLEDKGLTLAPLSAQTGL